MTPSAGAAPNEVIIRDVPPGATAVRYASGSAQTGGDGQTRFCCGPTVDTSLQPCPPASCPLKATGPGALPAVPFVATITPEGRCACLPPMVCDE